jgi:hypothetical protein
VLGYAGVLAHQGGWDEALMVVVPVGLFVGLIWIAAKRHAPHDESSTPPDEGATRP